MIYIRLYPTQKRKKLKSEIVTNKGNFVNPKDIDIVIATSCIQSGQSLKEKLLSNSFKHQWIRLALLNNLLEGIEMQIQQHIYI